MLPPVALSKTGAYSSWSSMLKRVDQKTSRGRYVGIRVDPKWRKFENFLADMGERPPGHTLDRIDSSKGYLPDNCRWATPTQQCVNRKNTVFVDDGDEVLALKHMCEKYKLPYKTIHFRLSRGWSVPESFGTPIYPQKGKNPRKRVANEKFTRTSKLGF